MILSDVALTRRLPSLFAAPPRQAQIQPASVDLTLAPGMLLAARWGRAIDLSQPYQDDPAHWTPGTRLSPGGSFGLACTQEVVTVPDDLVARVEGRSSLGRLGLMVHVTAGFVDPGFRGQITLELANVGPYWLDLAVGMRICQITFHQLSEPCGRRYGVERDSAYSDQAGVTLSRYRP